jgi:hypothetical protein
MRSTQIHRALDQGNTRFEICQLTFKGVRATHRVGTRFEDSIGEVMGHLGLKPASIVRLPGTKATAGPAIDNTAFTTAA